MRRRALRMPMPTRRNEDEQGSYRNTEEQHATGSTVRPSGSGPSSVVAPPGPEAVSVSGWQPPARGGIQYRAPPIRRSGDALSHPMCGSPLLQPPSHSCDVCRATRTLPSMRTFDGDVTPAVLQARSSRSARSVSTAVGCIRMASRARSARHTITSIMSPLVCTATPVGDLTWTARRSPGAWPLATRSMPTSARSSITRREPGPPFDPSHPEYGVLARVLTQISLHLPTGGSGKSRATCAVGDLTNGFIYQADIGLHMSERTPARFLRPPAPQEE